MPRAGPRDAFVMISMGKRSGARRCRRLRFRARPAEDYRDELGRSELRMPPRSESSLRLGKRAPLPFAVHPAEACA